MNGWMLSSFSQSHSDETTMGISLRSHHHKVVHTLVSAITHADDAQEALVALDRRVADGLERIEFLAARMESVDRSTAAVTRMCVVIIARRNIMLE